MIQYNQLRLPVVQPHHEQISQAIHTARQQGAYILEKDPITIAQADQEGRVFYTLMGDHFEHFCMVTPLVPEAFRDEFPIDEIGGLIANRSRPAGSTSRAAHRVREALATIRFGLATSRDRRTSGRVLEEAGMFEVERAEFPMLDAVTCDPTCLGGPESEPAWQGCAGRVACAASCVVAEGIRPDSCHLYVSSIEGAVAIEARLHARFGGNALLVRQAFGLEA